MSWESFSNAFDGNFYQVGVDHLVDVTEAPYRKAGTYKFFNATKIGGFVTVECREIDNGGKVKPYGGHVKFGFKSDPDTLSGVLFTEYPDAYQWALDRVVNPTIGSSGGGFRETTMWGT